MSTPLTADQILAALKAEGLTVHEHTGWATHNRDSATGKSFGPVSGVMIHHTAGSDSLSLCYNGRSDLPGPLCHSHLAKSGTVTMVGHGRANHAGTIARNAYDAVVNEASTHPRPDAAEPLDGNDSLYGLEVENLGNGRDPYPTVQYEAAVKWAAAICRAHGWTADSVIGHKEGTRRKVDPSFDMDTFRADVKKQLATDVGGTPAAPPATKPTPPAKPKVSLAKLVQAARTDPHSKQGHTTYPTGVTHVEAALLELGYLTSAYAHDGSYGAKTVAAYAAYQRHLGYSGTAADGIPGRTSLTKLGNTSGLFTVTA